MAEVVTERRVVEEPADRETVVVRDREATDVPRNNTGVVVAVIILAIILLLLIFGRGLFGGRTAGGGAGGGTNVNVQPTATSPTAR